MDYRQQHIGLHSQRLIDFILKLAAGEFLIPTFQRGFVWKADDICNLWDSVYRGYPIGSILYWKTCTRLHVHRQVGGFYIPENGSSALNVQAYILDGQQRATSFLVSFFGGSGKAREHFSFDYTLYFDLKNPGFFFEKDYYRHRWNSDPAFLIRIKDVPELPPDFGSRLPGISGYSPPVGRNLERLQYIFTNYSLPLICLQGFDIAGVCAIYERINQTGTRLKNMDILIARGFKNHATVVEEDFPVLPE